MILYTSINCQLILIIPC